MLTNVFLLLLVRPKNTLTIKASVFYLSYVRSVGWITPPPPHSTLAKCVKGLDSIILKENSNESYQKSIP